MSSARIQPQGRIKLNRDNKFVRRNLAFVHVGGNNTNLVSGKIGSVAGVSRVATSKGLATGFPNTASQGVSFGRSTVFTGTKQTILIVAAAQARGTQRNCTLNARTSTGPYIGGTFNADSSLNIVSGAFAFSWPPIGSTNGAGIGGYIPNAITGKTSAYAITRNGAAMLGSVDGQSKSVTSQSADANDLTRTDLEFKIGDLGDFSGTGYGAQDPVLLSLVFNDALTQSELNELCANPWQLFEGQSTTLSIVVSPTGPSSYSYTTSGGYVLSGQITKQVVGVRSTSGGVSLSGNALKARGAARTSSGGVVLSGVASSLRSAVKASTGILQLAGQATKSFSNTVQNKIVAAVGGVVITGAALTQRTVSYVTSGGVSLSGASAIMKNGLMTVAGTIGDVIYQKLILLGGKGGSINDMINENFYWRNLAGGSMKPLNDVKMMVLTAQGYTGSLNDMEKKYWENL